MTLMKKKPDLNMLLKISIISTLTASLSELTTAQATSAENAILDHTQKKIFSL